MYGIPERIERLRLARRDREYRARGGGDLAAPLGRRRSQAARRRARQARRVQGLRGLWFARPYEPGTGRTG